MAYALLIAEPVGQRQARTEAEGRALYGRMLQFSENLRSQGLLTIAQSLKTDTQGVRVRVAAGQCTVVDGPFAEAKEMIGGFFIPDLRDAGPGHRHRQRVPGGQLGHG